MDLNKELPCTMYKLLSQELTSHGDMKWEIGKINEAVEKGNTLCSREVLHCYENPEIAIIMNSCHARIKNPRLFRIATSPIIASDGLKMGTKQQMLLEEIELPVLSITTKIAFGILCALEMYKEKHFVIWAKDWLSGKNRTKEAAAYAAYAAAAYAANAAAAYVAIFPLNFLSILSQAKEVK